VRVIALCAAALLVATRVDAQRAMILPVDCRTTAIRPQATLQWKGKDVQWAEWQVSLGARRVPSNIVVVRIDPRVMTLSLEIAREANAIAPWSIEVASADAVLALNAGQFTDDGPWGWVMHRGREWQAPGVGTLAGAFIVDSSGKADVIDASGIARARADKRIVEAIQSYPMLLDGNGDVPPALCSSSDEINREHRDARLAIGVRADGVVVIAMSRYDGAGRIATRLPIGPTTPEMSEIMRRLGAVRAVMLDGGLSAQMLIRENGNAHGFPGLRAVPLALVAMPRR
jgi:exopolysaccharide biosynthesis protein